MPKWENTSFMEQFSKLFEENREKFIFFAYSYTHDMAISEDLFMDAVTSLLENHDRWEANSNLPALLLAILKNKSITYLTHEKTKLQANENISTHHQQELNLRISTLEACMPEKIFNSEIQQIVRDTLKELPPQSRRIFLMSRSQHKSNKDIANELSLSIKTVEFHMTKVLKTLRIALKDYLLSLFF
jgi:RNA polymerase sigma-70 factor, ECF subfamily